jgi:hypothetical protein
MSESAPALMAMLREAAKARRTSSKSNGQSVSDSSKEGLSNAEVAHLDSFASAAASAIYL